MKNRPNILFVMPDEFRQDAMGFLGRDPVYTPNIDRFAAEGLTLCNAVSSYPVCSPYRGQVFTGKYPYSNGVIGNCNTYTAPFGVYLRETQVCLSDVLSHSGYDCGYIGKWHLEAPEPADFPYLEPRREDGKVWDAFTPPRHRHHFNFWHSYGCNDQHNTPHYWHNAESAGDRQDVACWSPIHEADVAIEFIENRGGAVRDSEKPFFLVYAPNPPHMPFEQVPQRYRALYHGKTPEELLVKENALQDPMPPEAGEACARQEELRQTARASVSDYFACVSGVDEQFGRILCALDQAGLREDTIVLFTSDHGEMMGSHSLMYKGLWYDESFKVPFIIRYPGRIEPGRKEHFLNPPDLFPTLLELCGLEAALPGDVEGTSAAPWLLGGAAPARDEGFYINPQINARGVCTQDYLFVVKRDYHGDETQLLYDQRSDPCQMRSIAHERPETAREMRARLDGWLTHTKDIWVRT